MYFLRIVRRSLSRRGNCNEQGPRIKIVEVGLVVPDETLADEALDYVIMEEVMLMVV